jgi:putative nucleotidyltransferase with HDIG domain
VTALVAVLLTVPPVRVTTPATVNVTALAALLAGSATALFPWLWPDPRRFPVLLVLATGLVALAQAATGGAISGVTPLFVLVVLASACYPLRTTAFIIGLVLAGRTSFVLYEAAPSGGTLARWFLDVAVLAAVGVMVGAGAQRLRQVAASATLLPHLAGRAATAVEQARSALALQSASMQTMVRLAEAVEAREAGTAAHCRRVAEYSVAIAGQLGLSAAETREIERGALLHDIGKIGVPDAVLLKPGKLSEEEWVAMRRHAQTGYELLGQLPYLERARELVYAHHERWDGKGYPRGLRGAEIPLGARIFAVADAFDAMTSDRPYRKALPFPLAVAELQRGVGAQFDPAIVLAMLRALEVGTPMSGKVRVAARVSAA